MKYAEVEEYKKVYSNIEDKEIEKYLELASIVINNATLTRIERRGFLNLTSGQQEFIKKATIEEANYLYDNNLFDDDEVQSFSITDISISQKERESISKKLELSKLAYFYLKRTGLVNRII